MVKLKGKSVFNDVCIGKIHFYRRVRSVIKRYHVDDTEAEVKRFHDAQAEGLQELQALHDKAVKSVGEADAAIFEVHQMMMEDQDYAESVENIIRTQEINAEYAIGTTADNFAAMFQAMDDEYMRGRAADVKDISDRLVRILSGTGKSNELKDNKFIIAADDLAPSETVQLDKSKVMGFILQQGSASSHTAILARSMGIPAVIGLGDGLTEDADGKTAIVDGASGDVIIDPDEDTLEKYRKIKKEYDDRKALLAQLKGRETVTKDGQKIKIFANIGSPADVAKVMENDAEGIGLFRSEFLYLQSNDFPSEDTQFAAYKQVAENMAGKKVVIRTLDIGADKQCDYFNLDHEENPALGYRAIRICLTRPEIFKTQLRALYRAALYGNISIMFPMIISVSEVRKIKQICEEVKASLKADGIPYKEDVELGIMIETPAAALIADDLAQEVDFFSVGTNDLTQYTLAIDRVNRKLDPFLDTHHPAILKLIKMAADSAHKYGKWIGICGELGADPELTRTFLKMGIDELSVSPSLVLKLRDQVIRTDMREES
ncbi:MAG: phosphoenolpyruvate--protein phosphotransferase [Lachnospiraceae bacterium]|nr:phosphoenolpyruvate--protein phosphotransferase [Lachnospiraceae bacterium]MCH4070900.1 phosphoenolpyruvate--protein phosphotransferase [Lachnospiraceae bacterium]MCH4107889.1 phosphoenolpyruvate--protein phosphotransferase [Lachnospiraceae bacterium]MCI1332287.1 phosphoenolpyruvate--protein phosphotransferase [Lachnospiraceae bacterium]MCI1361595.1 phosphoenolpyruvate--protein phosphotransferase [Lachnospiraceae bacterium]